MRDRIGLFGTCGSPKSVWRQEFFRPHFREDDLFDPQKDHWTPEDAEIEADHLANDAVIVMPISKETLGYASLAEAGWAIFGALLRDQKLAIFVERDPSMSEDAARARDLFVSLASSIARDYPVFSFHDAMDSLPAWAQVHLQEFRSLKASRLEISKTYRFGNHKELRPDLAVVTGTSDPNLSGRSALISGLSGLGIEVIDTYRENWSDRREAHIATEFETKKTAGTVIQTISGETEGFGSLAESGLLALGAFVRGQNYALYLESYKRGSQTCSANRARILVAAHIRKINEAFPGAVFVTDSMDDLQNYAMGVTSTQGSTSARVVGYRRDIASLLE